MKKFEETQIIGGTGEKPKDFGPQGKDFKQMFLEVIANSQNPQERLAASQMLKNIGFEIGPDDTEKAKIVIEQIAENQALHKAMVAEKMAELKAQESAAQTETVEELQKRIASSKTEKPKHPVVFMPVTKPKSGQNPITPIQ